MRKLHIFLFSAAAILFASCAKDGGTPVQEPASDGLVKLHVAAALPDAKTKATVAGTDDENSISSIQVFVFKKTDTDSFVYESSSKADASELDLLVTSGAKNILVLVNESEDYTAETDYDAILAKVTNLKNNARDRFAMVGHEEKNVFSASESVSVKVSRVAARLCIKKITNNLLNGFSEKNVKVVRAYLTHVADNTDFTCLTANTGWYADSGINTLLEHDGVAVDDAAEKAAVNALIYSGLAERVDVAADGSYEDPFVLYTYPNASSAKKTHLAVEMEIDGGTYAYVIELPTLRSNHSYEINELVLKSLGNPTNGDDDITEDEDNPITSVQATFTVDVQDWVLDILDNSGTSGGEEGKWTI